MIILYEYTETAFTNNGLGCLNDATSCVVKETLNGEYELEMEYPVNGIHYSDIQLRRIILAKPNSYDQTQPFRIYAISKPIGGLVTVNAEHISYDMSGLPVRGALEHYAWYVNDVFEHIKNNSVYPCPFTFSTDITEEKKDISLSKPRSVRAFLGTEEGLLSLFGGEWEFDRYKAVLHRERGQNRGVSIEYGKNLTDVTQDEKCSEMYTAVYPYYYQEDDGLQRLDDDVVKILDTPYKNVYVLDLTSEFEEMPTQDQLRAKAQEYIKENKLGEPKVSLKVSFIKNPEVIEALHDVRLGDTVGVKFIKIGVDTTSRCINYEFNVLTEQYNSIELGEPTKTIVDTMTSTSSRIDAANGAIEDTKNDLDDTKDDLNNEIDRATTTEQGLSTRIDKTDSDITLEVSRAQLAEGQLDASLQLKLGRDENDQVISMINASADQITLSGNRLIINSNNFQLDGNGRVSIIDSLNFIATSQGDDLAIIGLDGRGRPMLQNIRIDTGSVKDQDGVDLGDHASTADYATEAGSAKSATQCIKASTAYFLQGRGLTDNVQISDNGNLIPNSSSIYCGTNPNPFAGGYSTGGWKTTSDRRKKKDFRKLLEDDRFERFLMLLQPMEYRFIENDEKIHIGFVAQDVEHAMMSCGISEDEFYGLEHAVFSEKDFGSYEEWAEFLEKNHGANDMYTLCYQEFIALNTSMIQKQQHEIEALKLENVQVKGELDILKQRLERLEEKLC
nr:MAG TPA: tail protein [Caudoviricetes sp.]